MRIKKHSNGNQYLLTPQNMWVRNFTKKNVPFIDINKNFESQYFQDLIKNEIFNSQTRFPWIDSEQVYHPNIVIVSDGYQFEEKHKILESLSKDVAIIGVHGSLAKWKVKSRNVNYYIVNNPYKECMLYFPKGRSILPKCIFSPRTNKDFIDNYRGTKMRYLPTCNQSFSSIGSREVRWQVDDYRNAICAAICLSFRFGVQKLALLGCDSSFDEKREGSMALDNGLHMYPQHLVAQGLIDANLYWLKNQEFNEVLIANNSSGPKFDNATYIESDKLNTFFEDGKYE